VKRHLGIALASVAAWSISAFGASTASFDVATNLLSMPTVKLEGGSTFSDVVIELKSYGTLSIDDPMIDSEITYVPESNTILLPAVTVGSETFNKVSLINPAFDVISAGPEVTESTGYGSLTIAGNAVGVAGQTNPSSFVPAAFHSHPTAYYSWSIGSGSSAWYILLGGSNIITSTSNVGSWQKNSILSGLQSAGITMDMPKGKIQFNNVTLTPQGPYSGEMILNGTLNVPPAVGTSVTISGTGTSEAGTGFNASAPATPFVLPVGSATKSQFTWNNHGIELSVTYYSTGDVLASLTNMAGPSWSTTRAKGTVAVDTANKTVTMTNLTIAGQSPTTTSITLNGTLSYQ